IAARSSQDFACCARAMAMARSKCASAFAASNLGDISAMSPATRWTSASHHFSLVVSTAVIASPMQRQASSNCPSSAWPQSGRKGDRIDRINGLYDEESYHIVRMTSKVDRQQDRAIALLSQRGMAR